MVAKIIGLLLTVLFFSTTLPAQALAAPVEVWGHRGTRQGNGITENTYEAYEAARKSGAYGIEVDLRLTRTGYWVIQHDESMSRTSKNCDKLVSELSYTQFKKCKPNSGSHFMSLKNTAKWAKKYKMHVDLDVKVDLTPAQAQEVYDIIKSQDAVKYFMPNGMNSTRALDFGGIHPGIVCASGVCGSIPAGVQAVKIDAGKVTSDQVRSFHARGYTVIAYDATDSELKRLTVVGVDGVMVDNPGKVVKELKKI